MELRRATPYDAEVILRFWRESSAAVSTTDDVGGVLRAIENPAALFLLAVEDGEIVGSLIGTFDGWRGNLYRLVVSPDRRRRGIGRQLVRRVEEVFSQWGVKRITALVEVDRPVAAAFWSAMGYPPDEHIRRHARTT